MQCVFEFKYKVHEGFSATQSNHDPYYSKELSNYGGSIRTRVEDDYAIDQIAFPCLGVPYLKVSRVLDSFDIKSPLTQLIPFSRNLPNYKIAILSVEKTRFISNVEMYLSSWGVDTSGLKLNFFRVLEDFSLQWY